MRCLDKSNTSLRLSKASQNSPPAMAANRLDHFCRDMCVAKNSLRGESVFSPIYGRKSAGRSDSYFAKKGIAFFDKLKGVLPR